MKKFKRVSAAVLVLVMLFNLTFTALAANDLGITYTATMDKSTLNVSAEAQTVVMTVKASEAVELDSLGADIIVPEGWSISTIENAELSFLKTDYDKANAVIAYATEDAENWTTDLMAVITYTVPAGAAVGTYEVGLLGLNMSKDWGGELWEDGCDVKTTVTIEDVPVHVCRDELTAVAAKAATCTEDGNIAHYICTCGKYYADAAATNEIAPASVVIAAAGHSVVVDAAKAPTCTETGLTAGEHCSVCGQTLVGQTVVPALGHKLTQVNGKAPTCTEKGHKAYEYCSVCDYTTYVELPATGHSVVVDAAKAPTCTETGLTAGEHCATCGKVLKAQEVVAAIGHDWSDWTQTKAPTEDNAGEETRTCANCGGKETRPVAPLGHLCHNHLTLVAAKAATCTKDGNIAHYACECGKLYADAAATVPMETEDVVIAATGHSYSSSVTKEPTCTEKGVKTFKCACGETYTEEIAALGHKLTQVAAKAPTCTEVGHKAYEYCSECDYTTYVEIAALGHTVVVDAAKAPTCTETGLTKGEHCSVCGQTLVGQTVVPALGHKLTQVNGKAPTCTEKGHKAYEFCSVCDYTTYEELPATGHDVVVDEAVAPTCTETGLTAGEHCATCGEVLKPQDIVAAIGHDWSDWTQTKAPTEDNAGEETRTCANCGGKETRPVAPLGHLCHKHLTLVAAKAPTCTEDGNIAHYACECGKLYADATATVPMETEDVVIAATGHSYSSSVTKEPTCTEKGVKTFKCACGDIYTEEIAALGHKLTQVEGKEPTCTKIGYKAYEYCSECDYTTYVEIAALGHQMVQVEGKAPTCTEKGYKAYEYCSVCDCTTYEEIAATGHDVVVDEAVAPTCTETGLTAGEHCATCGEVLKPQDIVAATGHDWSDWTQTKAPTEEESGEEMRTCANCGAEEKRATKPLGHLCQNHLTAVAAKAPTCTEAGNIAYYACSCGRYYADATVTREIEAADVVIAATGHSYSSSVTKEPTCTEKGVKTFKCACGDIYTEEIAALGHKLTQVEGKVPTCIETGYKAYEYCSACDYTTYVEIAALGHQMVQVEGKAPTCTEKGYKAYEYCSVCDCTTYEEIAATGHDVVVDEAVASTCTETGLTAGEHCATCGEVLKPQDIVAATGHDWSDWTQTKAPTEEAYGEETRTCANCGGKETRPVAPLGHLCHKHLTEIAAKAPTCTEDGNIAYYACECGKLYADAAATQAIENVVIAATGHSYSSSVTKEPTCTEKGVKTFKCACGETYTEEIAALGHKLTQVEGKAPTCTETGYKAYEYCSVCDYTTYEELAALGHTLTQVDAKAPTCTEIGHKAYEFCSVCDYTTYEEIAATGHDVVVDEAVAPTCTETGLTAGEHCATCGEVLKHQDIVAAIGHDWSDWTQTKAPTEEAYGEETRTCANCGGKETRPVAPLGHLCHKHLTLVAAKAPTCTEAGNIAYYACECGKLYADATATVPMETEDVVIAATGHSYSSSVTKEPTCTEKGVKTFKCACGETYTEEIAALGHKLTQVEGKAPTCTETGYKAYEYCSVCDYTTYEELAALGHTLTQVDAKAPTCTEIGHKAYEFCSVCDYTTYEEIAATGHDVVVDEAVAPTCTETGLTAGEHCATCGEVLKAQEVIAATGHKLGEFVVIKESSFDEMGEEQAVCEICDYVEIRQLPLAKLELQVQQGGITELPDSLKEAGMETLEEVKESLEEAINKDNEEIVIDNVEHYDVKFVYSKDGGKNWHVADEEHWPDNGKLTVEMPYPAGTDSSYTFVVAHMFTSTAFDKTPGDMEFPEVTKTEHGLRFEVTGLSPISIGWEAPESPETGDSSLTAVWVAMLCISACGAAVIFFNRKRTAR